MTAARYLKTVLAHVETCFSLLLLGSVPSLLRVAFTLNPQNRFCAALWLESPQSPYLKRLKHKDIIFVMCLTVILRVPSDVTY